MKIISIDPGYERCGVAILEKIGSGKETVVYSGCIRTSANISFPERLEQLGSELDTIIKNYHPSVAVLEELYFAKNTKTALKVSEARGVIQYVARTHQLPIFEYHPNQIKIAITGDGRADKTAIAFMIPKLVLYEKVKNPPAGGDDELDAIAVGLTHFAHTKTYT